MTSSSSQTLRRYAGISFRPEVLHYLDTLVAQSGMNRSWVLNAIVSEHAKMNHSPLAPSLLSKETIIQLDR